jgi:soluble lytic murein transglycosylase-like protein
MQRQLLKPALLENGRPSPPLTRTYRRATVYSLPVSSIPIALLIFLIFIVTWASTIIRPNLTAALQSSGNSAADDISNADTEILSSNFSPQVLTWSADILKWAHDYQLDPNIIALVMQIESCGFSQAHSQAGAMGLFQVMPFHFGYDEDPYDPSTNANRGLAYLARSLELANGRLDLALAGYNGGHLMIDTDPSQWPDETQRYVYWGVQIYNELNEYKTIPPTLQEWLDRGGENLCKKAANAQTE